MPLPPYHGSWLQPLRSGSHRPLVPVCLHTPAVPAPTPHCRPGPSPSSSLLSRHHAVWFYFLNPRITHICSSESELLVFIAVVFIIKTPSSSFISFNGKKNVSSLVQSAEARGRDTGCLRKCAGCLNLCLSLSALSWCAPAGRARASSRAGLISKCLRPHLLPLCPQILCPAGPVCGSPDFPRCRSLGFVPGAVWWPSSKFSLCLVGLVFQQLLTDSGHIAELEASVVHPLQGHLTVLPRRVAGALVGLPCGHL